jgi:hypothetical protein
MQESFQRALHESHWGISLGEAQANLPRLDGADLVI